MHPSKTVKAAVGCHTLATIGSGHGVIVSLAQPWVWPGQRTEHQGISVGVTKESHPQPGSGDTWD